MDPVVTAATLPAGRTALGISAAMDPVVTAASLPAGRLAIGIPAAMDPVVTASSLAAARAVLGVSKSTSVNVQDSPFLAVGDGSADDRAAILAATTAAGANGEITFGAGTYKIAGNLTIPCAVRFAPGAKISVPTGITVTLSKAVTAGIYQIFSLVGTGQVALTASQVPVGYPEWWGAVTGGPDCLAAINAALVALPKTELQAADYWVSGTVLHATANHWLAGKGSTFDSLYGIGATRLLVTNGSSHCLQVGPVSQPAGSPPSQFPLGIRTTGISCARTVAPVATSGCDAIRVSYTLEAYFEDVRGDESMNGWEFVATVSNRLFNCKAKRSSAGTGGTDSWKGFYANGASPLFAGGNASLYIAYSHADDTRATVTNGSGFYFDGAFTDGFLSWCETVSCTTGINIQGNSATGLAFSNTDLHIKDCVNDVFKVYGILVTNIGEAGSVEIVGGYEGPAAGATAARCVNTSNASVNVVGGQLVMGVAPACLGIYVNASTGVRVSGTQILECGTTAVALAGASNCDIQPIIKNRAVTGGAAVQLSGTPLANYIKPTVLGKASGSSLGIQVVGVADARNEYNCSGIDSSCLAGGSAGKLNRNAVAITATGLSGTNLVSGVMT